MKRILIIILFCIFTISNLNGCSNKDLNDEVLNKPVENILHNEDKNKISAKNIFFSRYNLVEFNDSKLEKGTEYLEKIDPENYYLRFYDNNGVLLEPLSSNILNRLNAIAKIFDGKYAIAPVGWTSTVVDEEGSTWIQNNNWIQGISSLCIPYIPIEDDVFIRLEYNCSYDEIRNRLVFVFYVQLKSDDPIKESTIINNLYKNNLVDLISYYPYDTEEDEEYYKEISNCINDRSYIRYEDDNKEYSIWYSTPDERIRQDFHSFEFSYRFYIY